MRLLTAPGVAGIAIVAALRDEREAVLAAVGFAPDDPWRAAAAPPPRRAALRLADQVVDDVLLVSRSDGTLELHLHGSPAVLAALDRRFGLTRVGPASAAERLLREALGPSQLALALEQLASDFRASLAVAAAAPPDHRRVGLLAALERSRAALAMVSPARVALIGRQNAGKSTLFNCLLQKERVMTGPHPGLTRDPVRESTLLDGYPYELVDTAGEGAAVDAVDCAAIEAARAERGAALQVLLVDLRTGPDGSDLAAMAGAALIVGTKRDLIAADVEPAWPRRPDVMVAARDAEPGMVRRELGQLLREVRGLPPAGPVGGFAALDEAEYAQLHAALQAN